MQKRFKGKAVLVTGGAHGLGKAICCVFAQEGADIAVNYNSNAKKAQETAAFLEKEYGVKTALVGGDITDEATVKNIFDTASAQLGRLDVLVNNSGICPISMVADMRYQEWQSVINVNLNAVFLTSREMIRYLQANDKPGVIVNVASQAAFNGSRRGKSHYSASKGGVVSFTNSLAKEVAPDGIRVNAIAPGMMYTEMTKQTLDAEMDKYNAQIPLGRIADVNEVAQVVVFLASDDASYITGTTVDVSGGITGR